MNKLEKFIEKSIKRHGDKYDYSKVEYVDSITKVCIICPEHGEFWQTPQAHVRGNGCPKCANRKRGDTFRSDCETFIMKAKEIHDNKYDYSKVNYVNASTKVCIICPEHGEFFMIPMAHLMGQGCPKCSGRGLNTDEVIKLFRDKHGDKYDYSKVEYKKMHEKVCIICPEHGEFWQTPSKHLLGQECPKCSIISRSEKNNIGGEEFVRRAKSIYGDKYIYDENDYTKMADKMRIICPKHGEFWQLPYDHLHGHGCPKCGLIESRGENEIYEYVCTLVGKENVEHSNRTILDGYEIDIYVPNKKIGIEYNGLKWHSDKFRDRFYHYMKLTKANEKGVKLIQVFEDEYLRSKELVLSKISSLLHVSYDLPVSMARKCYVREIDRKMAKEFLNKNHIQGYKGCTLSIGCFDNENLVGVMTFEKIKEEWILNRFATDYKKRCPGVGGKLFSYFVEKYNPTIVKSFADLRWTTDKDDNLYTKIGFKLDKILKPEYRYVNTSHPTERIHKFNFRKKVLEKKYKVDSSLTETKLAEKLGFHKIWDCGMARFVWKKN